MDQERTLLIVAVGVAVAAGCFVLWGPSTFRPKKRKGHIVGLLNLGHTCFLNTLLQALASCPTVVNWIELNEGNTGSLVSSLRTILRVLNGESDSTVSDPYAPTSVINALRNHNWVISPGEQDAHELFHVLLDALEEEMSSSSQKTGSLSDILPLELCGQGDDPSRSNGSLGRRVMNGGIKCDGDQLTLHQASRFGLWRVYAKDGQSAPSFSPFIGNLPLQSKCSQPPFRGTLTSQLKCTECGFKSPIRFDKFDSLSLPLPNIVRNQLTLQTLLDNFISPEFVKDVTCSSCSKGQEEPVKTTAMKTLNFGKLPKCLCLHIVRTTWNRDGSPQKREDFVDFPEFLPMDTYTHMQVQRNNRKTTEAIENSVKSTEDSTNKEDSTKNERGVPNLLPSNARHLYRLKAVVVHTGSSNSGHFITFRKGPIESLIRHRLLSKESIMEQPAFRESARWFYTSDMVVRKASLCDALLSNAYLLFYEKCVLPDKEKNV